MSGNALAIDWSNGFTISFWMKGGYSSSSAYPVYMSKDGWKNESKLYYKSSWNRVDVSIHDTNVSTVPNVLSTITDGEWHHIAIVLHG